MNLQIFKVFDVVTYVWTFKIVKYNAQIIAL